MDNFGLIAELKALATLKDWNFYLDINNYYTNAVVVDEQEQGVNSLIVKVTSTPKWSGLKTAEITYKCKIMLARKMDMSGQSATLDETYEQKYDRRLKDLETTLDEFLKVLICNNELSLSSHSGYEHAINVFDMNIDAVVVNSITLVQ